MFEQGEMLRTWALAKEPSLGQTCDAELLPDHRPHYLEYEGPVSGDRGHVTQWDRGTFSLLEETPELWFAQLAGARLVGHVRLVPWDGSSRRWRAVFS